MSGLKKYYIVNEEILPEAILKTAQVKEMLARREVENIMEAVDKLGMSRSTYYKYKDGISAFFDAGSLSIINLAMVLNHAAGVLSGVLNMIASYKANVLTINQNLPLHGVAYVTMSLSVEDIEVNVDELLSALERLNGVLQLEIVGRS